MARSGPDTATSSFFICIGDQPELDFGGKRNPDGQGFAAFGRVVRGMDVVRKIQQSPGTGQTLDAAHHDPSCHPRARRSGGPAQQSTPGRRAIGSRAVVRCRGGAG